MNLLARLKRIRQATRLYDALSRGDTTLLVELFPFVKKAFTPKIIPPREPKKPLPPPKVVQREASEEEDLRDALDIGFSRLKFDPMEGEDAT